MRPADGWSPSWPGGRAGTRKEASPLLTPGAGVTAGTAILAVNGQAVDAASGPAPLLANQAGLPVELIVAGPAEPATAEAGPRTVVVPTSERRAPAPLPGLGDDK